MNTIWKFFVEITDHVVINMPKGAKILKLDKQQGLLCLWCLVDDKAPDEQRYFRIFGTGRTLTKDDKAIPLEHMIYIDTFQLGGGKLVFHMFEVKD